MVRGLDASLIVLPATLTDVSNDQAAVVGVVPVVSVNVAVKLNGVPMGFREPIAGPVMVAAGAAFGPDALPLKFEEVGVYVAVITCCPNPSAFVCSAAVKPERLTVPNGPAMLSVKVTEPRGVSPPEETVAVRPTRTGVTDVSRLEVRTVTVGREPMVSVIVVLAMLL